MKLFLTIAILFSLSSCVTRKEAILTGYKRDGMILESTDTIFYRSNNKGLLGDRYTVLYRFNKVIRVQKK